MRHKWCEGQLKIKAKAKAPLSDAASANSTQKSLLQQLKKCSLPLETGCGRKTKYNRIRLGIPKEHSLQALCVDNVDLLTKS
ncbi:MAG: hypothetical protein J5803_02980 [Desulfovibrio sp.]|nr:hypothetical protein [Desulfovibrio sp.]